MRITLRKKKYAAILADQKLNEGKLVDFLGHPAKTASAIAELKPGEVDWEKVFAGKDWFHFTGITPAISKSAATACDEAAAAAKQLGLTVSADMNYRGNLWSAEEAQATMIPMMKHVDVSIGNEEDAEKCLGVAAEGVAVTRGEIDVEAYRPVVPVAATAEIFDVFLTSFFH